MELDRLKTKLGHDTGLSKGGCTRLEDFMLFGLSSSAFLDVSNVFNFNNIQTYNYTFDSNGHPTIEEIKLWPILPTLGMTIKF